MKIQVSRAALEEKPLVERMVELYQYDFTEFEDNDLDGRGIFGYPLLDTYWSDTGRFPFIVRVDGKLAGFVLVTQQTALPESEWAVAEFFVMRKYRRKGVGKAAAFYTFDQFRGKWETFELAANLPAQQFWRRVISEYAAGEYQETQLDQTSSKGVIQTFDNSARVQRRVR